MSDDWDKTIYLSSKPVIAKVAKKQSEINAARRTGAVVATDRKIAGGSNKTTGTDHARIAKIDREDTIAAPPKVSLSVGRAIQDGRQAASLSQKDLAQKINEKPSVLQDYESSRAIPNPQILGKLERALGVKLRGSNIGQKLEGPKKTTS